MTTLFLLDTDVISNLRKRLPHRPLRDWIGRMDWRDISIPIEAVFEIQRGIELARPSHPELSALITQWLDSLLATREDFVALPTVEVARLHARMTTVPALRNFLVSDPRSKRARMGNDLAIAALAIVRAMTVVTFNVSDFLKIHAHFPLPGLIDARTMADTQS